LALIFFNAVGAIMSSRLSKPILITTDFGERKSERVSTSIGARPATECIKTSSEDFSLGVQDDFSIWDVGSDFF
jgi:hypothetical protein